MATVDLFPKQSEIYYKLKHGQASWLGNPGGRGAAKSSGIDRVAGILLMECPGVEMSVVMRNYDQVRKFHIEPFFSLFPEWEQYYNKTDAVLKMPQKLGGGKLQFSYAESLKDVERRFRSGNYRFLFVDQAEQFTKEELIELRKCCRSKEPAKMLLSHNMGGASIQYLRQIFYDKQYNEHQDPNDYDYVHVYPWDNVYWVAKALEEDGLTQEDYYKWEDSERKIYAAIRGEYTKQLASDDDAIRNRDWESSWDSLEGAYFGRVFDRNSVMVSPGQIRDMLEPWHTRWIGQDWGKSHFCVTYWCARIILSPEQVKKILGWEVSRPVGALICYRELIVQELGSADVAKRILQETPQAERESIRRFFLSPDAFGERDSGLTIADKQGKELKPYGMPVPEPADTDRIGGATLLYNLLAETKNHASSAEDEDIVLISSECKELLNVIPAVMRDPKNLDDILKTDKGSAKLEQDVIEAFRYACKSMLRPRMEVPRNVQAQRIAAKEYPDAHSREMALQVFHSQVPLAKRRSNWRRS